MYTIYTPIYAGFRPMSTLEALPSIRRRLNLVFNCVGSARRKKHFVAPSSPALALKNSSRRGGWRGMLVFYRSSHQVLVIHIRGTAQVKATKEDLYERVPTPKTCSNTFDIVHDRPLRPLHDRQRTSACSSSSYCVPRPSMLVFPN